MPLSKQELRKIADDGNLHFASREVFVKFIQDRFPEESDPSYVSQWVERFKTGNPFSYADSISKKALLKAYGLTKTKKYWK